MAGLDAIRRYTIAKLTELVEDSTPRTWAENYIPRLLEAGALRRVGKAFLGRRSEIEAALLASPPPSKPTPSLARRRSRAR